MKLDKARKLFSEHYEGTLSEGLKDAFERALASDNEVKREYEQFVQTLQAFEGLKSEVQVPADLHDRIDRALDAKVMATKSASHQFGIFSALKPALYGGLAASLAILIIVSSNNPRTGISSAGMLSGSAAAPELTQEDSSHQISYGGSLTEFSLSREDGVDLVKKQPVDGLNLPLVNRSERSVLITAEFGEEFEPIKVALPGTRVHPVDNGSGTLAEFAKAVSDRYGVAVQIVGNASGEAIDWTFESNDAVTSLADEGQLYEWVIDGDETDIIRIRPLARD